ncbi:Crp/Fnr family transcriptional regulator [Aestuariispira insulae]|uniref:CRP/FNR family transcriptional regulator n=1 Tax=Aestuariispira insulae TaxID=1461337 RepID=A0A3D9H7V0_9PROT|nr:helix-turn-helix domain-containing protein [Aestuariispira insulae]RED45036.1 CRP/FNR family transcriptional regulator [Aestuariispira insulae]
MSSSKQDAAAPLINAAPQPKPDPLAGTPCAACSVRDLSLCNVLREDEMEILSQIVTTVDVAPREPIIDEGEVAGSLFNVTGGAVKLYKLMPDGRRQITGFLFAGDFLGIALNDIYAYSAEAVNQVKLCRFPSTKLEDLLSQFPHMEKRLLGMASNELVQAQEHMLLLGRKSAKEKVCSFLLSLSRRAEKRGEQPSPISVPMSRADIGDYLGLTTETVSRTFTNLKRDGFIRLLEGGIVDIPDMEKLEELADGF